MGDTTSGRASGGIGLCAVVYVMTWHDRHIDDIVSVHASLDGANAALDEQRDSYEMRAGETWADRAGHGDIVRVVQDDNSGDYWGDVRRIEVEP